MGRRYDRGFFRCGVSSARGNTYSAPYSEAETMSPENELKMLRADEEVVKNELNVINRRIEELEKKSAEES